jgi:hypothetical protein
MTNCNYISYLLLFVLLILYTSARLYHQSFSDFLHHHSLIIEDKRLRNSYYLNPEEWHKRIVEYYRDAENKRWSTADWNKVDHYGRTQIASYHYRLEHLIHCHDNQYQLDYC